MADPVPFEEVPVEKLMTPRPTTLDPDSTLLDAAQALLQGGYRHLPIVDDSGRPIGIISERDLRARLGTDLYGFTQATVEALSEQVSGVMTPNPITVELGTPTVDVLDTFADERVGALLVVDEAERLRGVLSYVDLLLWLREHPSGSEIAPRRPRSHRPGRASRAGRGLRRSASRAQARSKRPERRGPAPRKKGRGRRS